MSWLTSSAIRFRADTTDMRFNDKHTTDTTTETEIEIERPNSGTHSFAVEHGKPSRGHATANFGCPRCDRELNPGPWNSWICWACGDVIYVEGSENR